MRVTQMCLRRGLPANSVAPTHVKQYEEFHPCSAHLAHRIDDGSDMESLPEDTNLGISQRVLCSGVNRRHRDEREIDAFTRVLRLLRRSVDEGRVPPFRFSFANKFELFCSRLSNSGDAFADALDQSSIALLLASEVVQQIVSAP